MKNCIKKLRNTFKPSNDEQAVPLSEISDDKVENAAGNNEQHCDENCQQAVFQTLDNIIHGQYELAFDRDNANNDISRSVVAMLDSINKNHREQLNSTVQLSMQASSSFSYVSFVTADSREISQVVSTISSAIEQLNVSINQIAHATEQVSQEADNAKQVSQTGLQSTQKALASMKNIQESVSSALERVEKLTTASEQIGSILEVIEDIANKTNLLALNATIEAARAGEAGKGFAVVANEVKGLSSQTASATEQIREQIAEIRRHVKNIGEAINTTDSTVGEGSQIMEEVGNSINEVVSRIDTVAQNIAETSSNVSEQTTATQEVARSVSIVQDKTQRNRDNAEKTLDAVTASEKILTENFKQLEAMKIPGAVVEFAKSDHYAWKRKLAEMVLGRGDLTASELKDHHACRLGKWYDNITEERFKNHPVFAKIEEPHSRVHAHGRKMAELFEQGDRLGAMQEYEEMDKASHDVVALLNELSQISSEDE